jgi:hypothetical protein
MENLIARFDLDQRNEEESITLAIDLLSNYNLDVSNEYTQMLDTNIEFTFEDVLQDLETYAMRNVGHSVYVEESQLYIIDDSSA